MNEEQEPPAEGLNDRLPEREHLVNVWRAEIEFFERLRRENGAAVIGVRLLKGPQHDEEAIADFLVENISREDLFTKFDEQTCLIDTWGKDLTQLNRFCHDLRAAIPVDGGRTPCFRLGLAMVINIPFNELHYNDTLKQVMHRLLELLNHDRPEDLDYIPYDSFWDMERTDEQSRRLKDARMERSHAKEIKQRLRDLWDERSYPNLT